MGEVDELFGELVQGSQLLGGRQVFQPAVDVYRTQDPAAIVVVVELAGVGPEDVQLAVADGVLVIAGRRQRLGEERCTYERMEIARGVFERRIPLADPFDSDRATASFSDGLLTIVLPLARQPAQRVRVSITTVHPGRHGAVRPAKTE